MDYKKIVKQAVDLHVHIGPEIIPRKFDLAGLVKAEKGKIRGIGVKNHFFPAVGDERKNEAGPIVINSITLNNYVGGLNADIVEAVASLSVNPIIVWFPTISARNFVRKNKFEIPPEWIDEKLRGKVNNRPAREIRQINILGKDGELKKEAVAVLRSVKKNDAILATGHISWQETEKLVNYAVKKLKIRRIIVTHPIYQKISMPLKVQRELAEAGAFIEQCFSMYSIDKIPMKEIARQIRYVGAGRCILSSDVGQKFSPGPSEALLEFIRLLEKEGVTEKEIFTMLVTNPNFLVS